MDDVAVKLCGELDSAARSLAGTRPITANYRSPAHSFRFLDSVSYHLGIGPEPIGFLDELAVAHLEHLDPAAALMVLTGDFERRDQTSQCEVLDLLEALLDVLTCGWLAAGRLESIADRLNVNRGPQNAAIVHDRVVHRLRRFLALRLIHCLDFLADRVFVTDAGERQRVIAFGHRPTPGC